MKNIIVHYLNINLPVPNKVSTTNSWSVSLYYFIKNIKNVYNNIKNYFFKEEVNLPHVVKFENNVYNQELDSLINKNNLKLSDLNLYNNNLYNDSVNFIYNDLNSTLVENIITNTDLINNFLVIEDPYVKFLSYFFNEFNLFI
uniref:hypothetical protein n=1 Tax=Inonotus hispidus TaxID=40469 RepID=UPI002181FB52|nr:hypothetical protein N4M07_mgp004 [Inonotus hispidus]UVF37942.1 hypothetical protein [Inonotus hispidus]